jgi:CRISPR/Cas system CMR subunit Cmr4 (Cas7 group RAMP superfamily)
MATRFDRISITYTLTFETPFHCGTGLRAALIDRTVVRDRDQYLYVPGSTIKGVIRERCEQLEYMYRENAKQETRDLIHSPHDAGKALVSLGQHITIISRIFGSHYHPGSLFFEDAHQKNKEQYDSLGKDGQGKYKKLQTDLYTQVRLYRPTRTAVSGALYTSEFGVRDITLQGSIQGWLRCTPVEEIESIRPTYSLLLLLAGMQLLDRLGGNKSTGKGKCHCEIETVKVGEQEYAKEQWQRWFEHLDALTEYPVYQEDEEE